MKPYIPFEKRSKKEQKKQNARSRRGWGGLNPVTRKPKNPRAYDRAKARRWRDEPPDLCFFSCVCEEKRVPAAIKFYVRELFPGLRLVTGSRICYNSSNKNIIWSMK